MRRRAGDARATQNASLGADRRLLRLTVTVGGQCDYPLWTPRWMISCKKVTEINWVAAITKRHNALSRSYITWFGLRTSFTQAYIYKKSATSIFTMTWAVVDRLQIQSVMVAFLGMNGEESLS